MFLSIFCWVGVGSSTVVSEKSVLDVYNEVYETNLTQTELDAKQVLNDETFLEKNNGTITAKVAYSAYEQRFGFYIGICLGTGLTELFDIQETGMLDLSIYTKQILPGVAHNGLGFYLFPYAGDQQICDEVCECIPGEEECVPFYVEVCNNECSYGQPYNSRKTCNKNCDIECEEFGSWWKKYKCKTCEEECHDEYDHDVCNTPCTKSCHDENCRQVTIDEGLYFSQFKLNQDGQDHFVTYRAPNFTELNPEYLMGCEDLEGLGDADYNDLVLIIKYLNPIDIKCCDDNTSCDDELFCNGEEMCVNQICITGESPCSEGTYCIEGPIYTYVESATGDTGNTGNTTTEVVTDYKCSEIAPCDSDSDCDNGLWCDGEERCVDTKCVQGTIPCPNNGNSCDGEESCDEENHRCYSTGNPCDKKNRELSCGGGWICIDNHVRCVWVGVCPDDGNFCNGVEYCDPEIDMCKSSGNPCLGLLDRDDFCVSARCDREEEMCYEIEMCEDDGLFCNGEEYCNDDEDMCTQIGNPCAEDEVCNEKTDTCDYACTDDGNFCNGKEIWTEDGCVHAGNPCNIHEGEACLETGCFIPYGDVAPDAYTQGDGVVDVKDYTKMWELFLGCDTPEDWQAVRADLPVGPFPYCASPDGLIRINDIRQMLKMCLGLSTCGSW